MTTYSAVGSNFQTSVASESGASPYSITVSGGVVGNIWVAWYLTEANISTTSISGGGVTTWTKVVDNAWANGQLSAKVELWWGIITSAGATSISVATASSLATHVLDTGAQQFHSTDGSGWAFDNGNWVATSTSATAITMPSLTPTAVATELYVGMLGVQNTLTVGSTSGVTYWTTAVGDGGCQDVATTATLAPTATQSPAGFNKSVAGLFYTTPAAVVPRHNQNFNQAVNRMASY